jgi:hypothetical protein
MLWKILSNFNQICIPHVYRWPIICTLEYFWEYLQIRFKLDVKEGWQERKKLILLITFGVPNLIKIRSLVSEMITLNILADKTDEQTQPLHSALILCTYCSYYAERVGEKMVEDKQRSCLWFAWIFYKAARNLRGRKQRRFLYMIFGQDMETI